VAAAAKGEGEIGTDKTFSHTAHTAGHGDHPGRSSAWSGWKYLGHKQDSGGGFTGLTASKQYIPLKTGY